jgi:DNA-binding HxlR family transcriptional regulator
MEAQDHLDAAAERAAPRTEYSLTVLGHTLRPILEAMAEWGDRTQDARL